MELGLNCGVNDGERLHQQWQRVEVDELLRDLQLMGAHESRTIEAKPGKTIGSLYASSQGGAVQLRVNGRTFELSNKPLLWSADGHFPLFELQGEAPAMEIVNVSDDASRKFSLVIGYRNVMAAAAVATTGDSSDGSGVAENGDARADVETADVADPTSKKKRKSAVSA